MTLESLALNARYFSSDSRDVDAETIFVALKGENKDGHDYVLNLLESGAAGFVVEKSFFEKHKQKFGNVAVVVVDDTHDAHWKLASIFRSRFKGKVVAVGGSSGKTTTKDFLFSLIASHLKAIKTEHSQNGLRGLPKTLERLDASLDVAVIEVGIDALGDMAERAKLVKPDIAILTSIGEEHLNLMRSVENVFKEECLLFEECWAHGGLCFAPEDDVWLNKLRGRKNLVFTPSEPELLDSELRCKLPNRLARQNAALAAAVALSLGLSASQLREAMSDLELPEGRGRVIDLKGGGQLIADHYNSNPSSLRGGLAFAVELAAKESLPLYLVLGDMLDLGENSQRAHQEIVADINQTKAAEVFLVGPQMRNIEKNLQPPHKSFLDSREASNSLKNYFSLKQPALIFVKGSRGMALEHVIQSLTAH